jgi:hypothetical protein
MKHISAWVSIFLFMGLVLACSKDSKTPAETAQASNAESPVQVSQSAPEAALSPAGNRTGVFINGREIGSDQVAALVSAYHSAPPAGRYWYDSRSGAWGVEGRETLGFILPGYDFGSLAADASAGNTGVFINGREINMVEAANLQRIFGSVYRGHWWLDGRTGNFGVEGNPMPVGNLIAAIRGAQGGAGTGDNFWSSATARGNSSGGCSYVSVDGATATSGCD